jgi:ABC-type dipeptide/oligopeptide/nickel transport system ATPase component
VVETGPTARVLDRPEAEYTARLLQDVPKLSLVRPTRTSNPTVVSS